MTEQHYPKLPKTTHYQISLKTIQMITHNYKTIYICSYHPTPRHTSPQISPWESSSFCWELHKSNPGNPVTPGAAYWTYCVATVHTTHNTDRCRNTLLNTCSRSPKHIFTNLVITRIFLWAALLPSDAMAPLIFWFGTISIWISHSGRQVY